MDKPINPTFAKFGWPATKIAELDHWGVMLRPVQPVLGALVLCCKQPVTAFGEVDREGHRELGVAVNAIERMLKTVVHYEKINYLMLMMDDPDVHFHVLPRYSGTRSFGGLSVLDEGWPKQPNLGHAIHPTAQQQAEFVSHLRENWTV